MEVDSTELLVLLSSLVLLFAILLVILTSSWKVLHVLHESGAVLIFGVLIGVITWLIANFPPYYQIPILMPSAIREMFYVILLPCIIFNAGFSMKKRNFFKNIVSILTYAVFGTIVSCATFGGVLYGLGYAGWIPSANNFIECMLFGALMSATDPVATLALFLELNVDPLLYSLVFGESVLNDAIAIVLFRTLSGFIGVEIDAMILPKIVVSFLIISLGSLAVGVGIGFFSAFVMNKFRHLSLSPTFEMTLVVFWAYISYLLADVIHLSGILALFVVAILSSHYHWYSIARTSRITLFYVAGAVSFVAETAVFLSLGLSLFETDDPFNSEEWDFLYILASLLLCFISRAANVIPLSLLLNLFRKQKIPLKHIVVLWFAGLRGAIALILALSLTTPHARLITNTTYVIVLFTNLGIGIATKPLLLILKIEAGGDVAFNVRDPEVDPQSLTNDDATGSAARLSQPLITRTQHKSRLHDAWRAFDDKFLKPMFGGKRADVEGSINVDREYDPSITSRTVRTLRDTTYSEIRF
ncbi:sodium/hydrogen exchanger 3 protein [Pelomyxa schiedti]|nr:sodium/hydrogen exchanger 3 protein [Pelomyxa schiedti]